jgi:hypothetical protein
METIQRGFMNKTSLLPGLVILTLTLLVSGSVYSQPALPQNLRIKQIVTVPANDGGSDGSGSVGIGSVVVQGVVTGVALGIGGSEGSGGASNGSAGGSGGTTSFCNPLLPITCSSGLPIPPVNGSCPDNASPEYMGGSQCTQCCTLPTGSGGSGATVTTTTTTCTACSTLITSPLTACPEGCTGSFPSPECVCPAGLFVTGSITITDSQGNPYTLTACVINLRSRTLPGLTVPSPGVCTFANQNQN